MDKWPGEIGKIDTVLYEQGSAGPWRTWRWWPRFRPIGVAVGGRKETHTPENCFRELQL